MVRYYDLNKPIPELNNLSLTQVFEDGQLLTNGNFSNGTTGWTPSGLSSFTVSNGIATLVADGTVLANIRQASVANLTDKFYANVRYKQSGDVNTIFRINFGNSGKNYIRSTEWTNVSRLGSFTGAGTIFLYQATSALGNPQNGDILDVDYAYLYNLTALGIDLTKEQMDYWFSIYQDSKGAVGSAFVQHAGIDTVIPNLNNKTLREVFEDGNVAVNYDFTNSTSGWAISGLSSSSLIDQVLTINVASSRNDVFLYNQTNYPLSQFYFRAKLRVTNGINSVNSIRLRYYNGSTVEALSTTTKVENQWYEIGFKPTITGGSYSRIDVGLNTISATSNEVTYQIDGNYGIYSIDLTSLGIDTLTQAEMDYYFSLYQSWKQKTLYIGKSKNLFDGEYEFGGLSVSIGQQGVYTTSSTLYRTKKIIVQEGITYTASGGNRNVWRIEDINGNNITPSSNNLSTLTMPTNAYFAQVYFSNNDLSLIDTFQLEQRTFATNYEQYYTPKTWIAPAFQQHALTDTKLIDTKLAYLNGYSIREVFESNLVAGSDLTNTAVGVTYTRTNNNVFTFNGTSSINYSNVWVPSATYDGLIYLKFHVVSGSVTGTPTLHIDAAKLVHKNTQSRIDSYTNYTNTIRSFVPSGTAFTNYTTQFYAINLTALGIDHLTQAELDQMFALYQDRNKNLITNNLGELDLYLGYDIVTPNDQSDNNASSTIYRHSENIFLEAGTYTISVQNTDGRIRTITEESSGTFSSTNYQNFTITYAQNVYFNFRNSTTTTWTYAETLNGLYAQLELGTTATPYHAYGGFSLKDVFETGNLFGHGDWQQDYTNLYDFKTGDFSHQNNHLLLKEVDTNVGYSYTLNSYNSNEKIYFRVRSESNYAQDLNNGTRIVFRSTTGSFLLGINPNINLVGLHENSIITQSSTANFIELRHLIFSKPSDTQYKVYQNYAINLTTLNIADLTKDFMDDLYGAYSKTYQAPAFIDKYGVLNAPSFQVTAGLDTAFADLNGLTLREVFEDGNLVSNGTFDINVTGWVNGSGTISWETQTAKTTRNNIVNGGYLQFNTNLNYLTSDKVYVSFDVKKEHNYNAFAGVLYFVGGTPYVTNLNNVYNNFDTQSTIITFAGNSTRIQMFVNLNSALSVAEDLIYFYDNIYHVNLTALGINLTKEQMDWYFQLYKTYKGGM